MSGSVLHVVLGSRSPRRRELLRHLVPPERITVLPPRSSAEEGFDGLTTWDAITDRLRSIAQTKCDDVAAQVARWPEPQRRGVAVLTADTIIVATADDGRPVVLGQPPDAPGWERIVRDWFHRYYLGRTHAAATAVCLAWPDGRRTVRVVISHVTFAADAAPLVEWYLSTGEPRGKAGGYALQGAGSAFVTHIEGSPSNVVGLPLREVMDMLRAASESHGAESGGRD